MNQTPYKASDSYGDGDPDPKSCLDWECVEVLKSFQIESIAYIQGERAQVELKLEQPKENIQGEMGLGAPMSKTGIPYATEGWNWMVGCPGGGSDGCRNCWACELHDMRYNAARNGKDMPDQYRTPFRQVQIITERIEQPEHWKNPRVVATCFQSDMFNPDATGIHTLEALAVMDRADWHQYLLLTKAPASMFATLRINYTDGYGWTVPDHVWPGVSICNRAETGKLETLCRIHAFNRWVSFEPLLGPIDTIPAHHKSGGAMWWVIGAESGKKARPCKIEWVRKLRDLGRECGALIYIKQLQIEGKLVTEPEEFPEDLRIREVPEQFKKIAPNANFVV